ncbi:MAG: transposase domain-containing protein [Hyphomicrobiales bacterium]|nr:transposase domain-containing protein [Hyphomicrobiales bacterium]
MFSSIFQIHSLAVKFPGNFPQVHDEGGKNWALYASLIKTCKMNAINPFDFLKTTLEALATGRPQSRIDELLTRN